MLMLLLDDCSLSQELKEDENWVRNLGSPAIVKNVYFYVNLFI